MMEQTLLRRAAVLDQREAAVRLREDIVETREVAQMKGAEEQAEFVGHHKQLLEANEHLVLATLEATRLRVAAQQAHRRQEEFLALLAHELRNPLAPIRTAVAVLGRPASAEPVRAKMQQILERQLQHMVRLVDDLLDLSRVTQGLVVLQRRPCAVSEFVLQAVDLARESLDAKRQQLTLNLLSEPLLVDGDPVRLVQIVGNLLHNAAKYTQEGGAIAVTAMRVGNSAVIRVSDNGLGIAPEALSDIFDLFAQENASRNHSQGGLGVGLTIVRRMVKLHGGTVEAISRGRGQGSEFVVTLPCMALAVPEDEFAQIS
jgi:signal transduction histidine kinase